ncbi:MAG TPA: hypothetical protein VIZ18_19775, partial [Ktedonobacteraceae bacterium]
GIGGFVYSVRSFFRTLYVRRHGKRIAATVTKIDMEYVLSFRGHTTLFSLYADWEDPETHTVYHFKSDAGGAYLPLNHPPGSSIDVLIDPRNPRRYEVQLKSEDRNYIL